MSADTVRSGTGASAELFFEDLTPGRRFDLGVLTVDGAEMVAFARRFDPQWYHVDEEMARQSHHGGLIASGFYTVSLFMRAYVDHVLSRAAADASPGLEELRWLAPVRAGDRLAVRLDVMGSKPSTARPGLGTVTLTGTMLRLDAEGRPECEVLRTRFRGWFTLRTTQPEPDDPATDDPAMGDPATDDPAPHGQPDLPEPAPRAAAGLLPPAPAQAPVATVVAPPAPLPASAGPLPAPQGPQSAPPGPQSAPPDPLPAPQGPQPAPQGPQPAPQGPQPAPTGPVPPAGPGPVPVARSGAVDAPTAVIPQQIASAAGPPARLGDAPTAVIPAARDTPPGPPPAD